MYIIIKRDKAEHVKEKLHHIKKAACEVLDCIEEAAARRHEMEDELYEEECFGHRRHEEDFDDDMDERRGRRGRSMSRSRSRYDRY